jgi:hypothetical protein
MPDFPDEETDNPNAADDRNFYKLEKWTRDGMKIDRLLYAGNNLDKARDLFASAIKHRPRIRLTIRQRTRVLDEYPRTGKASNTGYRVQGFVAEEVSDDQSRGVFEERWDVPIMFAVADAL